MGQPRRQRRGSSVAAMGKPSTGFTASTRVASRRSRSSRTTLAGPSSLTAAGAGAHRVALSRPEDLGLPLTQWSVSKLRAYCLKEGLIPAITDEWVRRLLRREGVSYQHTKTWKQSPDPEFEVKKTKNPYPRPLRALPRRRCGRLLRRVRPGRTETAGRSRLGTGRASAAVPGDVSAPVRDGAVAGVL